VDANSLPRYPKGQSKTCYQECGCHSMLLKVMIPVQHVELALQYMYMVEWKITY